MTSLHLDFLAFITFGGWFPLDFIRSFLHQKKVFDIRVRYIYQFHTHYQESYIYS
jgi:hypothetical protein